MLMFDISMLIYYWFTMLVVKSLLRTKLGELNSEDDYIDTPTIIKTIILAKNIEK